MATYNGERFLAEQLTSILSQLSDGDEVIVVDDASRDGTLAIVDSFGDRRVRLLRQECNQGILKTFERALGEAKGEIVFLADQDDVWRADKVAKVTAMFSSHPGTSLILSDYAIIDAKGDTVLESRFKTERFHPGVLRTLVRNQYHGCAMAFRRSILEYCLPFPTDTPMHDMWIGMVSQFAGKVALIDEPLVFYRRHDRNESPKTHAPLLRMLRWRWALVKNLVLFLARTRRRKN
jgi:glycosyltransferase involved in cell wall biosynthesis